MTPSDGEAWLSTGRPTGTRPVHSGATGIATVIDLGGASVSADGLVLAGKTLYANENSLNRIAVIRLSPDLSSGTVSANLISPDFDVPTTPALFGSSLYAVNAKFSTPATPETPYEIGLIQQLGQCR